MNIFEEFYTSLSKSVEGIVMHSEYSRKILRQNMQGEDLSIQIVSLLTFELIS